MAEKKPQPRPEQRPVPPSKPPTPPVPDEKPLQYNIKAINLDNSKK